MFWLTEMYLDEVEVCYKPKGWDLVEGRGYACIRHSFKDYANKPGQKVILETRVSPEIEAELQGAGLIPLNRALNRLKDEDVSSKIPQAARSILNRLE